MKHAGTAALDRLETLLLVLRALGEPGVTAGLNSNAGSKPPASLREKSRGVFYLRSQPFLHFHEDPTGLYADLRTGAEFERFPVDSHAQWGALLRSVAERLERLSDGQ